MFSIKEYFVGYPAQLEVANLMLTYGICLKDDVPYICDVELSDSQIARAAGVDRRVVRQAIDRILRYPELEELFIKLGCTSDISLSASAMGCSSLRIVPVDDAKPGLLAHIMNILFELDVNIRQALVMRKGDGTPTELVITFDGGVPASAPSRIYGIGGIAEVKVLSSRG